MTKTLWSPQEYSRFGDERSRPFYELLSRIPASGPRTVVDLGCASGALTVDLARRWPDASVLGLDSSAELLATAPADLPANLRLEQGDIADFRADGVDVLFTNAALQWLPQHRELIATWAGQLNPGGYLAFQVPGNFGAPSHALMRQVAESPRWVSRLSGVLRGIESTDEAEGYARLAISAGLVPDAWETTYMHLLTGEDPVLRWVHGTGLRPVVSALPADEFAEFESEYAALLRRAYPRSGEVTPFGFRRIFCVASKPDVGR
ncbi:putative trans-aconitate methyltransferase [Mycobacteroides stephanolepidis]|uniref:Putative trans-aconitate methyltransferase n=1 Tax=[Mycobacterium] stephanolepidis TaxID=1520670 RepID=A0A1Z4EYS2_9MYCO|nr:methyltransferase domain-containing protein [[Mycobacterium] stephanolepidis]BAX98104.1 putative trans-aconitate methyltransferase [[Mycobacterium] stephanolepidis]